MIKLSVVYVLAGLVFAAFAILSAADRNNCGLIEEFTLVPAVRKP